MFSFQKPTHILVYREHQIRMIDTEIWNTSQVPFGKIYLISSGNAGEKWKGVDFLCYLGRLNSEKKKKDSLFCFLKFVWYFVAFKRKNMDGI